MYIHFQLYFKRWGFLDPKIFIFFVSIHICQIGGGSAEWTDKKIPYSQGREDPERTVELEFFEKNVPVFDLDDLLRASAEVLGKGKLGTTYKATLESGVVVAVKRLKNMDSLSKKEFIQQMQLLGKMRHEKLVQIISFYYSKQEKLVIYEFIPNGNLFELLHGQFSLSLSFLNYFFASSNSPKKMPNMCVGGRESRSWTSSFELGCKTVNNKRHSKGSGIPSSILTFSQGPSCQSQII